MQKGKYYELDGFVFNVKEIFDQEGSASYMILVDDWVGDLNKVEQYNIGPDKLLHIALSQLNRCKQLVDIQVEQKQVEALMQYLKLSESDDAFLLPIKMTPERRSMMRILLGFKKHLLEELQS